MFVTFVGLDCTLLVGIAYAANAGLLWWGWKYTLTAIYNEADHHFEATEH
jgi:hypothetical protein